jgi:hypothetical protein
MPTLRSIKNKIKYNSSDFNSDKEKIHQDLKNCFRCKKDYHERCFENKKYKTQRKINGSILENDSVNLLSESKSESQTTSKNLNLIELEYNDICYLCHDAITIKIKNTKISDYFKPSKNKGINFNEKMIKKKFNENQIDYPQNQNHYQNHFQQQKSDIIMFDFEEEKKLISYYPKFILFKPIEEKKMEILKKKFLQALLIKNIEFSDDLKYLDEDCPESMNNSCLEPGIQKMSSENKKIFYKFKEFTRQGDYPGLEIFEDKFQVIINR